MRSQRLTALRFLDSEASVDRKKKTKTTNKRYIDDEEEEEDADDEEETDEDDEEFEADEAEDEDDDDGDEARSEDEEAPRARRRGNAKKGNKSKSKSNDEKPRKRTAKNSKAAAATASATSASSRSRKRHNSPQKPRWPPIRLKNGEVSSSFVVGSRCCFVGLPLLMLCTHPHHSKSFPKEIYSDGEEEFIKEQARSKNNISGNIASSATQKHLQRSPVLRSPPTFSNAKAAHKRVVLSPKKPVHAGNKSYNDIKEAPASNKPTHSSEEDTQPEVRKQQHQHQASTQTSTSFIFTRYSNKTKPQESDDLTDDDRDALSTENQPPVTNSHSLSSLGATTAAGLSTLVTSGRTTVSAPSKLLSAQVFSFTLFHLSS